MHLKSHISTGVADNSVSPAQSPNCCPDLSFGTPAVPPLLRMSYADSACSGRFFLLLDCSILLIMNLILSILICSFWRMLMLLLERPHGFNGGFGELRRSPVFTILLSCSKWELRLRLWKSTECRSRHFPVMFYDAQTQFGTTPPHHN